MIRLILGLFLFPTAALTLVASVKILGRLALREPTAWPFVVGVLAAVALWLLGLAVQGRDRGPAVLGGRLVRWFYVLGHELTHAFAAWSLGAKVHDVEVGCDGGHADISRGGVFISLAPYCVPIYTVAVVATARIVMWFCPGRVDWRFFLGLVGLTLAGHILMTAQSLCQRRQPDLFTAGGLVFSLAVISAANGLFVMILAKALFPRAVSLFAPLRQVVVDSAEFWAWSWNFFRRFLGAEQPGAGRASGNL